MSDTPMKLVVDIAKGTQEYIPLSAEEIAQREAEAVAHAAAEHEKEVAAQAQAEAKAALLTKLGITEDEAKLLLA